MTDSPLTLVSHALCPFVQRAAIALIEKGVAFTRVDIDLKAKPDWFLAISPLGKVPLLRVRSEAGGEAVLFESAVICEYLEESQPGVKLHPADPILRAQHRAWCEFASATLGDNWGYLNAADEAAASAKRANLRTKLARVEAALADGPYFAGAEFSLVDAAFAPVFRYFEHLPPAVGEGLFGDLPKTSAWRSQLSARPSVAKAVGPDFGTRLAAQLKGAGAVLSALT
jgi:glutathione S-transferase